MRWAKKKTENTANAALRGADFQQIDNVSVKCGAAKSYKNLHGTFQYIDSNRDSQEHEIDRITQKCFSLLSVRRLQGKYVRRKRPTEENRRKNGKNAW